MIKKSIVLIVSLLILSTFVINAQGVSLYIDSLEQSLPDERNPNARLQLFTDISQEYIYWESYEQGKYYAYEALALAQQIEAPPSNLEAPLLMLASAFYGQSNTDSLQMVLAKLFVLCTASGNKDCLIEYYNTQASLFDLSTHPDSSLFFYQKALKMSEGEPLWQDIILSNMGVIFSSLKLNDRARTYYQKSHDLALGADDIYTQGLSLMNISYTFIDEEQLDSANYYLAEAYAAATESGYGDLIAGVHCYMGLSNLKSQNLSAADSFLHLALNTYTQIGLEREIAETLPYIAQLYFEQGLYDKAKKTALKAIQAIQGTEDEIYLLEVFQVLADIYQIENNFQLSDQYARSHNILQDTIQQQTMLNQFSTLEMDYQLASKDAELKLITAQRAHDKKMQMFALIGTVSLVLLLAIVIYLLSQQSKRRRQQNRWLEKEVRSRTAELNKSNKSLKDYIEEMKSFTYITSHDLKEPLRNISSFTSLLELRLKSHLNEDAIVFMNQIKNNASQMHSLIEGILYYSTLETKENKKATLKDVDLNQLIENIKKILVTTIEEKKALIHCSSNLPIINSSPEALQVVIKNIIENGIKYNRCCQPEITVSHEIHPNEYHILIRDNGIDIEPQFQKQVFEMFKRLHNQNEFKGTGMGLAICRKLLHRLGGDISLQSKAGEGCLFTVVLPITAEQSTADSVQQESLSLIE